MDKDFLANFKKIRYLDGYFLDLPHPSYGSGSGGESWQVFLDLLLDDLNKSIRDIRNLSVGEMSLHLRLGDFKKDSTDYLPRLTALQEILDQNVSERVINLFSDEPILAAVLLEDLRGATFTAADDTLGTKQTLAAMAHSKKLVCSRSTFSWWAATLVSHQGGEVWWPIASTQNIWPRADSEWHKF